jgi:uncharacterized protein YndB with AHSA1/START domain
VNQLEVTVPSDLEIVMKRSFRAPRRFVFEALTKPELVKQWLTGPPGNSMVDCEIDLRVGGSYRYVWQASNGDLMAAGGVFREIVEPERIVCTESFEEDWYDGESLVTYELIEEDGSTLLIATMSFSSRHGRDLALQSGMETGVDYSYQQLDELVISMAAG